jgi:hypothetical protein
MAGITSGGAERNVLPRLEGRGVHMEKGNTVLTDGPRGPSGEGVGEEVCDAVTRKEAVLVGEAERRRDEEEAEEAGGRRRAWLPRVRLLLAGGSGFEAGGAAPGASVLLLLFPFSFSSGLRVGGLGIESTEAARVGRAMGVAAVASYSGGSAGCTWTAGMRRKAAGCVATAAMTGAAALWPFDVSQRGKREDDDDDVGVTQGGPTWQCLRCGGR